VIGAFAVHKNAINFTAQAVRNRYGAKYEKNFNRDLYYVYVLITDSHEDAIKEALRLRAESPYQDAWVYYGLLGKKGKDVKGTDINPVTDQQIKNVESKEQSTDSISETPTPQITETVAAKSEEAPTVEPAIEEEPDDGIVGKKFFFRIFRGDNTEQVEGDVNVIDAEKARKIGTYSGNKKVKITKPPGKSGNISLVCEIFGYRKIQRDINYNTPMGENIQLNADSSTVVPFELVRLQKGDHAIMFHVYFFNDAAIMRPESRYEVGSLLDMLKENPKYRIKIHGHTNGNHHGKIISLADGNTNFFALNNTKDDVGSAKQLSGQRAQLIKSYLVDAGIDPSRMEVKAWGGKKALYDKHSQQAQANVRVEIEILDN
jgi:outer membrane protein OmpA-like peptidoglycan-associated protein